MVSAENNPASCDAQGCLDSEGESYHFIRGTRTDPWLHQAILPPLPDYKQQVRVELCIRHRSFMNAC